MEDWRNWQAPQRILVVLAHPDDPEFFCGATIARWTDAGHEVVYWLLTCGDKGAQDPDTDPTELCGDRRAEQRRAADVLGVKGVNFLENPDGYLEPIMALRKEVTRIIRQERPDVLVACDPKTLYVGDMRINHPDHRAAGQVVLDAVFPAAGNPLYFPELMREQGLMPHTPREVWISLTLEPNERHDVTDLWERKIAAIQQHASQIGDPEKLAERMRSRFTSDSSAEAPRYEEVFRRIVFG
ncbi:MAG: PIG-L deacetylase family protein [Chloroflexota bacterium]